MDNQDRKFLNACTEESVSELFKETHCAHPLDADIIERLSELKKNIRLDDDDYMLFRCQGEIDELWGLLLQKAIICLRYYDEREPFKHNEQKTPKAY